MSSQGSQQGEGITPIDTDSEVAGRTTDGENSQEETRSRACARRVTTPHGNQVRDAV